MSICTGVYGELYAPGSEDEAMEHARRHYEIAAEAKAADMTVIGTITISQTPRNRAAMPHAKTVKPAKA